MRLAPPAYPDVLHVAANMRAADAAEIYATRWNDSPEELAADCMCVGGFCWSAGLERPIAVIGALPIHPGVWSVFMFATDEFERIGISLTKYVKRVMIPALVQSGAHRAECRSAEGHTVAHRWLESLGAKVESVAREYGRNGEDYRVYVWRRENVVSV